VRIPSKDLLSESLVSSAKWHLSDAEWYNGESLENRPATKNFLSDDSQPFSGEAAAPVTTRCGRRACRYSVDAECK
jgi:hypothetical protein